MAVKKTSKLTTAQKNKIYKLFKQRHHTKKDLATMFGCSFSVIKAIIANWDSPAHEQRLAAKKAGVQEPVKLANERWKEVSYPTRTKYEVSNQGRVRSYFPDPEQPVISTGVLQMGYIFLDYYNTEQERRIKVPFHIIVADHFVNKPSADHKRIIHLDYQKANNKATNLKWGTQDQFNAYQKKNPALAATRLDINIHRLKGPKLTLAQVEKIRKMLADPNRKITKEKIAAMYNIASMTVYRIQNGDIWGDTGNHVPYEKRQVVKISDKTIKEIKKKLAKKNAVQAVLAKEYGVSTTIINRIKMGITYKSV